jgi:hypothetical protein
MSTERHLDLRLHTAGDVRLGEAPGPALSFIRLHWSWPWLAACGPRHAGRAVSFCRTFSYGTDLGAQCTPISLIQLEASSHFSLFLILREGA